MPASPEEIEDLKTALKTATNIYIQAADKLQDAKRDNSGIEAAQSAFDEASEKLGEALEKTSRRETSAVKGGGGAALQSAAVAARRADRQSAVAVVVPKTDFKF